MKAKQRICSVVTALFLLVTMSMPAIAVELPGPSADLSGQLIILHTNDTHGRLVYSEGQTLGISVAAQLKRDYEAAGADVLLLDAGDTIQGSTIASYDKGASVVELMNQARYDAMVPGNHEFDYGLETLLALTAKMEFPLLSANLSYKDTGEAIFDAHTIIDTAGGLKVGVFGLSTPETMTASHPDKVANLDFDSAQLYAIAQEQVDYLSGAGCDMIIGVGHLGTNPASAPYQSINIIEHTTGIDLFIDGHSHTEIDGGQWVNDTLLVSTGEYFSNIGVVAFDGGELSARLIRAGEYTKTVPEMDTALAEVQEVMATRFATPFSTAGVDLLNQYEDGNVLNAETNLGDLAADAILYGAQSALGDQIKAAITNGGGIRNSITAGPVSRNDIINVFPFGNEITVVTVTGRQLLEALESACSACPEELGAFPQVAGISFTIDISVPYEKGEAYPDSTFFSPKAPGARVKDVMVDGQPLDLQGTYQIATNDFVAAGGDTYYVFKAAVKQESGVLLEDALTEFIESRLGGTIGAPYTSPQGRIQITAGTSAAVQRGKDTYTVVQGDSLWNISIRLYGSGANWYKIYEANRSQIADPNLIYIGQILKLPA